MLNVKKKKTDFNVLIKYFISLFYILVYLYSL